MGSRQSPFGRKGKRFKTMSRKNDILEEKQVLASFISKLPEGIIICDSGGVVLLNDSQSQAYLVPETAGTNSPPSMAGRPITAFIDKNLMEHALDEINEQLKQDVTNMASGFILQQNTLILQVQVVPILSHAGLFSGFVLILDDITLQSQAEKRVESLLKTLSKNARSPMASIRAAIEAMREFPGMDEDRQSQFKDIIYKEALVLSEILSSVSDEYTRLIHTKKSLKTVFIREFMQTVSRRARNKLGITCRVQDHKDVEQIRIKVDPYPFISAILFVLDRLRTETGQVEFHASIHGDHFIVQLDIGWKGSPLPLGVIKEWEALEISTQNNVSPILLKDALNQQHSALWTYAGQERSEEMPCLRFFIPADIPLAPNSFEPILALPETRIQIRDMELFDHSDRSLELDNRLLTELSYTALIREVNQASRIEEIIGKHSQLPRLVHSMLTSGTKIRTVTWLITALSDAILNKLMTFAIHDLGPPPVPFAFVTLGSEGRKEQTLKTDQDNAIIFKDLDDGQTMDHCQAYFLALGEKVCTWLDQSGFDFCQGGIMAKNSRWCQPLSVWKHYFSTWIHAASPEDLLHTSIFFDFRFAYGDSQLTCDLTAHMNRSLSQWSGFFRNMAENAIYFSPPIGLFGHLRVRSKAPHKHCIDIKMANTPIVDFARIYSLKHHIRETATQDRLYQLYLKKVLSRQEYNELEQAYSFNMQLRFMGQIQAIIGKNLPPDNYINPRHLSSMEKKMLKEVLKKIKTFQAKLRIDFIGVTDSPIS